MKHTIKWLALAMSVAAVSASNAADLKTTKVGANSSVNVTTDADGNVSALTTGSQVSATSNADTANVLSQRLSLPKVTVIRAALDGTEMAEIGLDQLDYLVVKTDAQGKPVVVHQSNAQNTVKPEEK